MAAEILRSLSIRGSCILQPRLRAFEAAAAARGDIMVDDGGDGATAGRRVGT